MELNKISNYNFPNQKSFYQGKVRDVYSIGDHLLMVTSDRISAFDVVLPKLIPFKGQVLNQIAKYFLDATREIVPNWLLATPDPNVAFGRKCEPIAIEMVVRGYVVGHLAREYKLGKREICGVPLPDGLRENEKLEKPIITPTTKAHAGHDEDISVKDILDRNIVTKEIMDQLITYSLALFQKGQEMANDKNLILVDTKYEFGLINGEVVLMDEIHTPDSSRYFYKEPYQDLFEKGLPQKQLSKEFVREWLIVNNFRGLEGQTIPDISDEFVQEISDRYILLYEEITGLKFEKAPQEDLINRIYNNTIHFLNHVNK